MIERSQLLALPFYQKEKFKGSYHGMCFQVEGKCREVAPTPEELAAEPDRKPKKLWNFAVTLWPGPLCFEKTPDELKQVKEYPPRERLVEEDLAAVAAYLNEQYEEQKPLWDTARYY